MLALVRAGAPSHARPPPIPRGSRQGEVVRFANAVLLRRVEGVGNDPGLGALPAPLGFRWVSVAQAFVSHSVAGRAAC